MKFVIYTYREEVQRSVLNKIVQLEFFQKKVKLEQNQRRQNHFNAKKKELENFESENVNGEKATQIHAKLV